MRSRTCADRGFGRDVLRQSVCNELSGNAPARCELRVTEAARNALASMAILAVLCLAFGVLPTYVIPMLDPASTELSGASASEALVPPFFASAQGHGALPAGFVGEFHDLGAQVGEGVLPGRGLVVLHRGGPQIRWSSPCPPPTCCWR